MSECHRPALAGNRMFGRFQAALALHFACFLALFVAWFAIAGQSGSPVPDNWPVLSRMLDFIGVSALATVVLLAVAPLAAWAAFRGSRWHAVYPALLLLNGAVTVALCAVLATQDPIPAFLIPPDDKAAQAQPRQAYLHVPNQAPVPVSSEPSFAEAPHHPCLRVGQSTPTVDAVGRTIRPGDLVVIRPPAGSDGPLPDRPGQAAQRKSWAGHVVMVDGTVQGGALRFRPTGEDVGREAPGFCLWPENVEHLRLH